MLDQTDGAVDKIRLVFEEVRANIREETDESIARDVNLGDHLGSARVFAESRAEGLVVVRYVGAHLMVVGVVVLAGRRQVVARVRLECAGAIYVGEQDELAPVLRSEPSAVGRHRRRVVHRAIAREDSFSQESVGIELRRKLEIAVLVAGGDAPVEHCREIGDVNYFDGPLDFVARRQPQPHVDHRAEHSVSSDGRAKQFGIFRSAAAAHSTVGPNDRKCDDVANEWWEPQSAPVHVRRERAADAELVSSGLLLNECPRLLLVRLALDEMLVKLWPLNAGLDLDFAANAIELDDARETVYVNQGRVPSELLTTHGMSSAGNAHASPIAAGSTNDGLHRIY